MNGSLVKTPSGSRWAGVGWWWLGSVIACAVAFLPMPPAWPPMTAETLIPPYSSQLAAIAVMIFVGAFLVVVPLVLPAVRGENRRLGWCVVFIVAQVALLRLTVEAAPFVVGRMVFELPAPIVVSPWIIPVGLAAILFGFRQGLIVAMATAAMAAVMPRAGANPVLVGGLLLAGVVALLDLRKCPRRWHVLRGCVRACGVYGAIGLLSTLLETRDLVPLVVGFATPVLVGLISGLVLLAILPLAEWVTGSLSDVTLIEYGSDHPLLDQLRAETPGTWNHSFNVADLAETAARAIDANALFCRTASLFHDIGKTVEPEIFAENQRGYSPHDTLSPKESATKIIAHVTNGLELARKHRLPKPFREIISEHHGTSLVRFFFARAAEGITDEVELAHLREAFRYPGPPPASRESGIIALADTVEAAARSAENLDEPRIRELVFNLIADRIKEGELDVCALTLEELAKVRKSFVATLVSRHHKRPVYPKGAGSSGPAQPATVAADDDDENNAGRVAAVKKIRPRSRRK